MAKNNGFARRAKRKQAQEERQWMRSLRSPEEQLELIAARPGKSEREMKRLRGN